MASFYPHGGPKASIDFRSVGRAPFPLVDGIGMAFSRRLAGGTFGPVQLLSPEDGGVTDPLQACYWPTDAEHRSADGGDGSRSTPIQWADLDIMTSDRSRPAPVRFSWFPPPGSPPGMVFDLALSTAPTLERAFLLRSLPTPSADLLHLYLGRWYYWQVAARIGEAVVAMSRVASFLTNPATPRWIRVPDTTNVRDLGGYTTRDGRCVRQGLLYRSAELNTHLHLSAEGRTVLLDQLGIRTDLDLRGSSESPTPALDPDRVRWINIPTLPYAFLQEAGVQEAYRRVFSLLADSSVYPLLFHCWGGADRAGTLAFLINGCLGVSLADLIRDYELTSLSVWGERSREMEEFQSLCSALAMFAPAGASVQDQVGGYLAACGVPGAHLEAIRGALLEPQG